jgi:uncharacterized SAM-binding protein YcdF (DUF218 family)
MSTFYFTASKIFWFFAAPLNLFLFLLILGVILLHTRFLRIAKVILRVIAICAVLFVLLPLDTWLMAPLEEAYSVPTEKDLADFHGVIVLGGEAQSGLSTEYNEPIVPYGSERLNKFIELHIKNPKAKFVFTGGDVATESNEKTESYFSKLYIEKLGFDTSSMIFEDKSRNTYQNAILSKNLVLPKKDEKWILITSASHMKRACHYFKRVDWDVIPYPVGFRQMRRGAFNPLKSVLVTKLQVITTATKEWIGLLAAQLF